MSGGDDFALRGVLSSRRTLRRFAHTQRVEFAVRITVRILPRCGGKAKQTAVGRPETAEFASGMILNAIVARAKSLSLSLSFGAFHVHQRRANTNWASRC